ncbi:MAG TPA: sigma 54-interacting transcriptional regulator [Kofleriaceae bacterium]|nr:sigma 54-interacting transcriptional regulator [Kofleriaceae bacterium]
MASKPTTNDETLTLVVSTPRAAAAAWLVVGAGTPDERRIEIGDKPLCIGSDPAAEVCVADPHVSRRHAEIVGGSGNVVIRDLQSRNGTYVDGIAVKEAILQERATIRIGGTTIRFETEAPTSAAGPRRMGEAVGSSPEMQRVFEMLERLAPSDLTITLLGETGVGKDVLAGAVHDASARRDGPFIVFDCGAAAPTLIESTLFGHEKGSFTGANATVVGAFERAHGGTLFFDEIGELSLDLQPKLLRALEQRRIQRIGSTDEIPVDVRILAATNRDLEAEVAAGRFRQDLFFRLSAAVVAVPPLRARLADLPELVDAILATEGLRLRVTADTLEALATYDWPGNVRELRNVLTAAAAMADADLLEPKHLLFFKQRRRNATLADFPLGGRSLESIERAAIVQTLKAADGNKVKAAKALGIAASTLYEKMRRYRIA